VFDFKQKIQMGFFAGCLIQPWVNGLKL